MKHKWHKEIKAWADGAEIEYFSFGSGWQVTNKPEWLEESEYRIKSQPKEHDYLHVYERIDNGNIWFSPRAQDKAILFGYLGKIKLEVDDE